MLISIVVFVVAYFFIASEKIDKTIASLLGASVIIFSQVTPFGVLMSKIDLNVLALLIGMMIIVDIMSTTGAFEYLAIKIANLARGNGIVIFAAFMIITAFISAFLDNVTTVILIAPITILICQFLEISAIPMLIMEAVFSNIGGTATLIGDPPNVLIGSKCAVSFNAFILNLTPVVLIVMVFSLTAAVLVFKKRLVVAPACRDRLKVTKPELAILDSSRLKKSLVIFTLTLIGFFLSHSVHVEPGVIALAGATVMTLVCGVSVHKVLEKIEWSTIFFFIGLFIMIGALEENGVFEKLGEYVVKLSGGDLFITMLIILWAGAFLSAIVDNIPLVIAMIPLIMSISPDLGAQIGMTDPAIIRADVTMPLLWSLALGACFGGNGTLVGASANVVIVQVAKRNGYEISFGRFTKYGLPMMILSQILASVYLYVRYVVFK